MQYTETQTIKTKEDTATQLRLEQLGKDAIEDALQMQDEILAVLEDEQLYMPFSKEELEGHFDGSGVMLGYRTPEGILAALGIYVKRGDCPTNYGHDIGIAKEELIKVGHIDTILVRPAYRGNKLQYKLCQHLEQVAQEMQTPILCATASPDNQHSVNNFLALGYTIEVDKIKYGGLRRYVLRKNL